MFPYWLLFSIFAAGAVQYRTVRAEKHQKAPLLGALSILAVLMIGFRYEVGADWEPYIEIFEIVGALDFGEALVFDDPGFALANWIAVSLGLDIWAVNLLCAAVFSWGLIRFAKRQPNPWLAVVVAVPYLVIVVAMGYTRQGVAIGLIMAALVEWDKRALLRFIFLIMLAATFHKMAVVILPLVALSATRNRFITAGIIAATAVMLYYLFVDAAVDQLVSTYIETEYSSQGAAIRVAMNVVPALVFLCFAARIAPDPQERKLWRNFSFAALGSVVLLFTLASSTAVDRMALYLIPLQLAVLSRLPHVFNNGRAPSLVVLLLVIGYSAAIQLVWFSFADHSEYWLPYRLFPLS